MQTISIITLCGDRVVMESHGTLTRLGNTLLVCCCFLVYRYDGLLMSIHEYVAVLIMVNGAVTSSFDDLLTPLHSAQWLTNVLNHTKYTQVTPGSENTSIGQ